MSRRGLNDHDTETERHGVRCGPCERESNLMEAPKSVNVASSDRGSEPKVRSRAAEEDAAAPQMATSPRQFERVQKESLPEQISRQIKGKILQGQLCPGDRLVETLIASQFQVGQNTVREALQILEHQSLVTKVPHVGTFVTQLTEEEVDQVYRVRIELEAIAVHLATENRDAGDFARLEQAGAELASATKEGDWARVVRTDFEFHQAIWTLAGNRFLTKALVIITQPLFAYLLVKYSPSGPPTVRQNTDHHLELLEMMRTGDAHRAYECAKKELQKLRMATLRELNKPGTGVRGD